MSVIKKKFSSYLSSLKRVSKKPVFKRGYVVFAVAILMLTSLYWALLGARIQAGNADQLANTYLFDSGDTFKAATLPGQHTFLLKWPIFLLIKLFGSTSLAFASITVGAVLLTVGALAYVIYRIERRPLIFGTLCLALASALLLVPIEPYPGALLPVNMAMITTRNLEYVVFIVSLILLVRTKNWQNWRLFAAGLLMTLLIASDKLFLSMYVGGAVLAMIFYALVRKKSSVQLAAQWLATSVVAGVLASGLLWLINTLGIVHISSGAIAGPYEFIHDRKELALGAIHAVLSLLTNLGANPVTDTRLLNTAPSQVFASFTSLKLVSLVVNISIAAIGLVAAIQLIRASAQTKKAKKKSRAAKTKPPQEVASNVSIMLIASTLAACGVFIITNHYYPVDARYLGIAIFTVFITLAAYARSYRFKHPEHVVIVGAIILISILSGLIAAKGSYEQEKTAQSGVDKRNSLVVEAIKHHRVDVLVGNYWRVLPIKLTAKSPLTVNPLAGCTQNRDVLSSQAWQLDLHKHSFAYILTIGKGVTDDYPSCSLDQITKLYGRPNSSVLLDGNLKNPKELLLFYDKGIVPPTKAAVSQPAVILPPSTVIPIKIENMPHTSCSEPTIMNIVAHEDDDLLFMNPDLQHEIDAGRCIRTIYVTSGDAGTDKLYWLGREKGSQDAYLTMAGLAPDTTWIQRIVRLPGGQFVTIANPRANSKISLVFMHLPDGNVKGQGFDSSHHESLSYLEHGQISKIETSDRQSSYSSGQLANALTTLMKTYHPDGIRTQANMVDHRYPADHSDHMAVGRYVKQAYQNYTNSLDTSSAPPLEFYVGYPIYGMPINVTGEDLAQKQRTFFIYAHHDGSACSSIEQCAQEGSAYTAYLKRQYKSDF